MSRPRWFRLLTVVLLTLTLAAATWWIVTAARGDTPEYIEPTTVALGALVTLLQIFGPTATTADTATAGTPSRALAARSTDEEKSTYAATSVIKLVDFRANHVPVERTHAPNDPDAPTVGGITVITDLYVIRREAVTEQGHISSEGIPPAVFFYSTSGTIQGASMTDPECVWVEVESDHMRRSYELRISMPTASPGEFRRVVNRLEYFAAFDGADGEYVETHIDRPTASLKWLLLFSQEKPCLQCTGRLRQGRRPWKTMDTPWQPVILENGQVVVWELDESVGLQVDDQYGLRWEW